MKLLIYFATSSIFFIEKIWGNFLSSKLHICDFYFNEVTNIKPVLGDKNSEAKEIACTINGPGIGDAILIICPRKMGEYDNAELVPSDCFNNHLYSPYTSEKNERNIDKLNISKENLDFQSFNKHIVNALIIPPDYSKTKNIYCRCDNRKTEKDSGDKKLQGKTGLIKLILNDKVDKMRKIDFEKHKADEGITINANNAELALTENEVIKILLPGEGKIEFDTCANIINIRKGFDFIKYVTIQAPHVFVKDITCKLRVTVAERSIYNITLSTKKSEKIDGCDFTAPTGDGEFNKGFVLNDITVEEKKCTIYIGSSKKKMVAGLKCPFKITPTFCFKHVLFEKDYNGDKKFEIFNLEDILNVYNIEFYSNLAKGMHIIGLPTKGENFASVRCICESGGKRGIMELKIASSNTKFISFILLLITIIILHLF